MSLVTPYIYTIVKMVGIDHLDFPLEKSYVPVSYGFSEQEAWSGFFNVYGHRFPVDEAIRAYEQIGYRCIKFKLSQPEVMKTQQEKFPTIISTIDPSKIWKE